MAIASRAIFPSLSRSFSLCPGLLARATRSRNKGELKRKREGFLFAINRDALITFTSANASVYNGRVYIGSAARCPGKMISSSALFTQIADFYGAAACAFEAWFSLKMMAVDAFFAEF